MYPVISLLRRAASKIVYVDTGSVGTDEGSAYVKSDKPVTYLDLGECRQKLSKEGKIPFFELSATATTSAAVAAKLTAKENEIYEALKLGDSLYTLFFGPGEETEKEGAITRRVRIVGAQGVWGWEPGAEETSKIPAKQRVASRKSKKLPPGTIIEIR